MIYRHLCEAILNPFFIFIFLFGLSLILLRSKNASKSSRYYFMITVSGFIVLSLGFLPERMIAQLEQAYSPVKHPDPHIRWIVVLGGGQARNIKSVPNNVLNEISVTRLIEGVRLYQQLPHAKFILSGGSYSKKELSEAENMASILKWAHVPTQRIVIEKTSINTADQAKLIKQWVKKEPFYLVTSAIHMSRAVALCRKQGLHPIPAPTHFTYYWHEEYWRKGLLPNPQNLTYLNTAWHEVLGLAWGKMQGQI